MGISYCVCKKCGEAFPDVADYAWCETCDAHICEDCYEGMEFDLGEYDQIVSCPYCRNEEVTDEQLLNYLLIESQVTKDELIEKYKKHMGGKE